MARNLKALGLILVVPVAIGALMASTAQAEEVFQFTSTAEHTTMGGESVGTDQFTVDGGTLTCNTVDYTGTVSGKETMEVRVTPAYAGCTADPFGSAHVSMNGCQFKLTPAIIEGSTHIASKYLACEAGKSMKIEATLFGTLKCTIHVPDQEFGQITVSEASGGDITEAAEIAEIEYDQTGGGTGFGACSTAEDTTNGTYVGHATINGGAASLSLDPIPHTVEILKKPIEFQKEGEKIAFEVKSLHTAKVKITHFVKPPGVDVLKIANGCTGATLDKQGDKCKEEVECVIKTGVSPHLEARTDPFGADAVPVKGC